MMGLVQNMIIKGGLITRPSQAKSRHRNGQTINEAFAFLRHKDPTQPDLIEYIGVVI